MGLPAIGSLWQHRNGNKYEVIMLTNLESSKETYPITVVYKNSNTGTIWSRKLSDWHKSMTKI